MAVVATMLVVVVVLAATEAAAVIGLLSLSFYNFLILKTHTIIDIHALLIVN